MPHAIVDYLVARDGAPPVPSGLAYDYVLGGDGLYVSAHNAALRARVPVCRANIRGLPPLGSACELAHGRIPVGLWGRMARLSRWAAAHDAEMLFAVAHDPGGGYQLRLPAQVASPTRVDFARPEAVLLEVHSHARARAFFSPTDTGDEQRLRIYGVIGRAEEARPEVRLRVGAYGYFLPVPWDAVFDGDPASVRDLERAPEPHSRDDLGGGDELPD